MPRISGPLMHVVAAATVAVAAAVASGCGERTRAPQTVSLRFTAPSGRVGRITVRDNGGAPGAWCATVRLGGQRPMSSASCGKGGGREFHGSVDVDCTAREALVFGAVKTGVKVVQPRRGTAPRVANSGARPAGVDFDGGFYVLAVDLRERPPRVLALNRAGAAVGRADLTDDARRCRSGALDVIDGF